MPESKIFKNEEFGYWEVPVMRPKRDADGNVVMKKGKPVIARSRNELSFTKYFYKPVALRTQDEIAADIDVLARETKGLFAEIMGKGDA